MYKDIDSLIIYRKSATQGILKEMRDIFYEFYNCEYDKEKLSGRIFTQINNLLDVATDYGFDGNLWKNYIAYVLLYK